MLTSERNPDPVIECSECGTDCTFENEFITDSEGDRSICLDCLAKLEAISTKHPLTGER